MTKKVSLKTTIEPTMKATEAIPLLRRQIDRLKGIMTAPRDNAALKAWESTTLNILNAVYGMPNGEPHRNANEVEHASGGIYFVGMGEDHIQENFIEAQRKRVSLLDAIVEQLVDLMPSDQADPNDDTGLQERAANRVKTTLSKFHSVVRQLRIRHGARQIFSVDDEYDVQDLLHALLRVDFDDIRAEEHTPSAAGKSARMDFLLKREKLVIEVKKTRAGLADKELGTELFDDIGRYRAHSDCTLLLCFIYDPENRIGNPNGLISDLTKMSTNQFKVEVVINPV